MKHLVTLMLAAGLLLGGATLSTASAVELKAGGQWQFGLSWWDSSLDKKYEDDRFHAKQRIRPEFRFIADENLSATLQLEIGNGNFGNNGWALGNDGNTVKVRYGYVDWKVPGTESWKVRMGMQYFETANYCGAPVMNPDIAGVTVSGQLTDNVGLSLAWLRPYNASTDKPHDAIDIFYLAVPINGEGFSVTPWGMYAAIGRDAFKYFNEGTGVGPSGDLDMAMGGLLSNGITEITTSKKGKAFWLGIGGELSIFDPFTIALDFNYGHADAGTGTSTDPSNPYSFDTKRAGWQLMMKAAYKLDFVTPALVAWYASGDDSNIYDGSERMPVFYADAYATNFGMDGGWYDAASLTMGLPGTWGLGLHFDNIKFIDQLSHNLRFTAYFGTNDKNAVRNKCASIEESSVDDAGLVYIAKGDRAYEITLENTWQVYKNFSIALDLGFIGLDLKESVWGDRGEMDDKMWKVAMYATYKF